jgi:hypothetical protein
VADWISPDEARSLLDAIDAAAWSTDLSRGCSTTASAHDYRSFA